MERLIYIILINYNGFSDTRRCVDSIFNLDYSNYHIIIVDNCSIDNSYSLLVNEYKTNEKITILKAGKNNGFASGNNFAIKYAMDLEGDLYLLLNNDTEVDSNILKEMVVRVDEETVVTPLICNQRNTKEIYYGAGYFNKNKCIVENGEYQKEGYVNFASGCAMLISRKTIEKVGFLPEEYFMYYEDVDYSINLLKNNIKILYTPKAIVYHYGGSSIGGINSKLAVYYGNRNRFYLIKKYRLGLSSIIYTVVTRLVRLLICLFKRNNDVVIIKAYKDFVGNIMYKVDSL